VADGLFNSLVFHVNDSYKLNLRAALVLGIRFHCRDCVMFSNFI
jgi:hypothetical protein